MSDISRRYAIISDLHSNLAALEAVMDDIYTRGISDIICLGDVVGYGPQPRECLDIVMDACRVCLMGNHDEAVIRGAQNFNLWAREAIEWTAETLKENGALAEQNKRRWTYIENMAMKFQTNGLYFVHGSPRHPTIEYILREDIYNGAYDKFEEIFATFDKVLFVGHSHTPCVIDEDLEYKTLKDIDGHFVFSNTSKKIIVNVGSVGQPRDNDARACYVEINKNEIFFHRVEYDVQATVAAIQGNARLSNNLGLRLLKGV